MDVKETSCVLYFIIHYYMGKSVKFDKVIEVILHNQ
jgi:hypothetical protein